jgi:benzoyl-CoA 2,3-dioxygenase component B
MLGAFNEETPDWLSFFMFTYFTDRDGKMQLEALAQSGFDPLSRTCRFMLAEEAHHMFVGYTGVKRIVEATAGAMASAGIEDPYDVDEVRKLGVIDLPAIQRKVNLHYSLTLDLFGSEESTNAANFFNSGLKGRFKEDRLDDDHQLRDATYPVMKLVDGELRSVEVPALNGLNARLRDDFMDDCLGGIGRWNREIASHGIDFEITLPHVAFNRDIGEFADLSVSPTGDVLTTEELERSRDQWLPTSDDKVYIESIMQPHYEPGVFAPWIAPPTKGINQKPTDYEYVKLP